MALLVLPDLPDRLVQQEIQDHKGLRDRLVQQEIQELREFRAQQDLRVQRVQ
jgi:hypothetical protein